MMHQTTLFSDIIPPPFKKSCLESAERKAKVLILETVGKKRHFGLDTTQMMLQLCQRHGGMTVNFVRNEVKYQAKLIKQNRTQRVLTLMTLLHCSEPSGGLQYFVCVCVCVLTKMPKFWFLNSIISKSKQATDVKAASSQDRQVIKASGN